MHFLVLAWDRTDEDAVARRDASRQAHMELITELFEAHHVVVGAGILDDDGIVRGSVIIVDYPDRAAVDEYLGTEPLKTNAVWERFEVHPLRLPDMYLKR
ncbi:MAG: uncharacterized protein QOC92_635 [Acidimicrobiaceae bacterium]|jgi:uncharacterized protein YciI